MKIKVRSLSDEIRYIRTRRKKYQRMDPERILEHEGRSVRDLVVSLGAHEEELKAELRATHLARAFLRGIPWAHLEGRVRNYRVLRSDRPLNPSKSLELRVERLAQKFGGPRFMALQFEAWLHEARAHLHRAALTYRTDVIWRRPDPKEAS